MKEILKKSVAFSLILILSFTLLTACSTTEVQAMSKTHLKKTSISLEEWENYNLKKQSPINVSIEHQCDIDCVTHDKHNTQNVEVVVTNARTVLNVSLKGEYYRVTCKNENGQAFAFHKIRYGSLQTSSGLDVFSRDILSGGYLTTSGFVLLPPGKYYFELKRIQEYGRYYKLDITQSPEYIQDVAVSPKEISVKVNTSLQLKLEESPQYANITERYELLSSDESIFTVNQTGTVKGVCSGSAQLIIQWPDGRQQRYPVTVTGATTKVKEQYGTCYSNRVNLRFNAVNRAASYKIYRSIKKGGSYKLLKEINAKKLKGKNVLLYKDETAKPDTKYYYKVAVRTIEDNSYGEPSKPAGYWTCPERKFKGKLSGKTISWKKVKGADGYWLHGTAERPHYKWGYHLWDEIFDYKITTRKTKFTISGDYTKFYDVRIYPYAKHDNKCYANGKEIVDSRDMDYWD